MVVKLEGAWGKAQVTSPPFRLVGGGDGLFRSRLRGLEGESLASMEELALLCPGLQRLCGGGQAAWPHFFRRCLRSAEHLPIERSVFECLQLANELSQQEGDTESCFIQLDETFRMNDLLARVFHHVYHEPRSVLVYSAVPEERGGNAASLLPLDMGAVSATLLQAALSDGLEAKLRDALDPRSCLVVVELDGVPDWQLTHPRPGGPESMVAAVLVRLLRAGMPGVTIRDFVSRCCFVNTPMHRQRRAVSAALRQHVAAEDWNVNTVDKMQGQEAECVLSLYGYSDAQVEANPAFVYSRHRINVALSRAKFKGVLVVSRQMLRLRPSILQEDPAIEAGFAMFRHLSDFCSRPENNEAQGQRALRITLTAQEIEALKAVLVVQG
jgi:hypothetical protein